LEKYARAREIGRFREQYARAMDAGQPTLECDMPRSRERVCLEAGLRLDINKLRRTGVMPRGLNGEKAGILGVRYPDIGFEQEIHFTSRPRHFGGRQFFFQCPATGRRCYVLWKPPGATRFCSRQAWGGRVAYQSQFTDSTDRAHLAKAKIRARLCDVGGWREPEGWSDPLPPRPKRMREATYARWKARFEEQERKLDEALLEVWRTKWSHLKAFA
jgi:hypothetical protein